MSPQIGIERREIAEFYAINRVIRADFSFSDRE